MLKLVGRERDMARRGPKPSGKAWKTVGVRMSPELLEKLEAHYERERSKIESPSQREKYALSDVIRECVEKCIAADEGKRPQ
jgi:hypothetical protein